MLNINDLGTSISVLAHLSLSILVTSLKFLSSKELSPLLNTAFVPLSFIE